MALAPDPLEEPIIEEAASCAKPCEVGGRSPYVSPTEAWPARRSR
jgi:hypothetical protein